MLNITGMDHLNINTNNLENTKKFYQDLFGFKVFEEGKNGDHPYAIIGKEKIVYLAVYEDPNFNFKKEDLSHIGFHIENFDDVKLALEKNNIQIDLDWDYKYSNSIYITDPSGYEIELSQKFGGDIHKDLAS